MIFNRFFLMLLVRTRTIYYCTILKTEKYSTSSNTDWNKIHLVEKLLTLIRKCWKCLEQFSFEKYPSFLGFMCLFSVSMPTIFKYWIWPANFCISSCKKHFLLQYSANNWLTENEASSKFRKFIIFELSSCNLFKNSSPFVPFSVKSKWKRIKCLSVVGVLAAGF